MEEKLVAIINEMADYLNLSQVKKLQEVLLKHLTDSTASNTNIENDEYLKMFLDAKRIEGCSDRTLKYYRVTVEHLLKKIETPIRKMSTEEIRSYLVAYEQNSKCGKVTIDNIRRNISSFFPGWKRRTTFLKVRCGESIKSRPRR